MITDTQTQVVPPTFFAPGRNQKVGALGSGFVIDKQGDIVTNDHVVQGASSIRVGFNGGVSYPARIVGGATRRATSPSSGWRRPWAALHPLVFDDASAIRVGDPVYAIGNPFGLDRTMTAGIVSATRRDIQSPNGRTIPNAIQTDAPINHRNSGDRCSTRAAASSGVNAQIQAERSMRMSASASQSRVGTAGSVARQLIAGGKIQHPWLGVQVETIDPDLAKVVRGLPAAGSRRRARRQGESRRRRPGSSPPPVR